MRVIDNIVQGTPEWQSCRAGVFTASRTKPLMANLKSGKPSAGRATLIGEMVVQRLTGTIEQGFTSSHMLRGIELEATARDAYAFHTGTSPVEVGFCLHDEFDYIGASPDGVMEDGLVEIKCPTSHKHITYLSEQKHGTEYYNQVQHQMLVTGKSWTDVCSFDDRFPDHLQLSIVRVMADSQYQERLVAEIQKAHIEIEETIIKLNQPQGDT